MPLMTLHTNQNLEPSAQQKLAVGLSKLTAEMLGKPESYVMVWVQANQVMSFGASLEACVYVQLKSLGLPEDRTTAFSAQLCDWISQQLELPANRIYIEFSNPARHLWGWDGRTFG